MTPMAQQSTGRPYLCLPTTSGAESKKNAESNFFLLYDHKENLMKCIYQDILEFHMGP